MSRAGPASPSRWRSACCGLDSVPGQHFQLIEPHVVSGHHAGGRSDGCPTGVRLDDHVFGFATSSGARGEPGLRRNEAARSVSEPGRGRAIALHALLGDPLRRRSIRSANGTLRSGSVRTTSANRPRPCNGAVAGSFVAGSRRSRQQRWRILYEVTQWRTPALSSPRCDRPVQPTRARRDPRQCRAVVSPLPCALLRRGTDGECTPSPHTTARSASPSACGSWADHAANPDASKQ